MTGGRFAVIVSLYVAGMGLALWVIFWPPERETVIVEPTPEIRIPLHGDSIAVYYEGYRFTLMDPDSLHKPARVAWVVLEDRR